VRSTIIGIALLAGACASAPRARSLDQFIGTQPLQVTARGSLYAGTATLSPGPAETVSGTFTLAGPVEVKGTLTGRTAGDSITFELKYSIAQNGCNGTMRLTGPMKANAAVEGVTEAQDSCVGRMTGTFKFGAQK